MDLLRRVVLGTILLASCACFPAWAQISPGELNKVHEALEGLDNCTACHERGAEVSPAKCLDCHSNISALIKMKHGMHSRLAGRPCTECHKDHLGRDAQITRFSETTFDHTQTGFALSGKHKPLQCAKCHGEKKFRIEKAALPESDKKTYLGLKADCAACHADLFPSIRSIMRSLHSNSLASTSKRPVRSAIHCWMRNLDRRRWCLRLRPLVTALRATLLHIERDSPRVNAKIAIHRKDGNPLRHSIIP
jgi:hypothetical protein